MCSQPPLLFLSPGRCASCGENVVGEGTGCTAMDQVFHVDCFVCMTCSTKLRGKPFFAVEKKAYCEPCYIVSNFFFSLQIHWPRCLVLVQSGYLRVHVSEVHIRISGGEHIGRLPGMFIYFHFRQPHFISSKPGELPPLTTRVFISSFSLALFCSWSLNGTVVISPPESDFLQFQCLITSRSTYKEDAGNNVIKKVSLVRVVSCV